MQGLQLAGLTFTIDHMIFCRNARTNVRCGFFPRTSNKKIERLEMKRLQVNYVLLT